ncbi:MAG: cell division protein FtsA [Chitinophagales bacterium]|nr:cell division protein FtsA [Chitinophagales bacterium]
MEGKIIQAIDIGTTKVAAIVAKQTANDKLEILGIGISPSFGVIRADVVNINRTVEAIKSAVSQAEKQSGFKFKEVYVGVAGAHINSKQHHAVMMRKNYHVVISQKDIDLLKEETKSLPLPAGDMIIEIIPQEYKVDEITNIHDPIGMPGGKIEAKIHVITGSQVAVSNIKRCVNEAGFIVRNVIMQPIASAAAVLCEEELQSGVALVDIGGGTTDIAVFVDGVIVHTAVIPFGGEIVTEDIRKGCRVLKRTAESIKVQHGCAYASDVQDNVVITIPGVKDRPAKEISKKMLAGIIQARMEDIIEAVHHEIQMSGLEDKLSCGIVLTGGGSKLKHLRQLTEYITGMDIKLGVPSEHLSKSKIQDIENPIYSTAIGLVIKGLLDDKDVELKEKEITKTVLEVEKVEPKDTKANEQTDSKQTDENKINPTDNKVEKETGEKEGKKPDAPKPKRRFLKDMLIRGREIMKDFIEDNEFEEFNDKNK